MRKYPCADLTRHPSKPKCEESGCWLQQNAVAGSKWWTFFEETWRGVQVHLEFVFWKCHRTKPIQLKVTSKSSRENHLTCIFSDSRGIMQWSHNFMQPNYDYDRRCFGVSVSGWNDVGRCRYRWRVGQSLVQDSACLVSWSLEKKTRELIVKISRWWWWCDP